MQKGNVKLLVASAVVIVLLASWAWYGDDGSQEARTELQPGDVMVYEVYADGVLTRTDRQTVLAVDGDMALVSTSFGKGSLNTIQWRNMEEAGITTPEEQYGEVLGTETIDTPWGEKECQIRQTTSGGLVNTDWVADNNVYYKFEYTVDGVVYTQRLVETTLFDDAPTPERAEAFVGMSMMPLPGTVYTLSSVTDTVQNISLVVLDNDGETVTLRVY